MVRPGNNRGVARRGGPPPRGRPMQRGGSAGRGSGSTSTTEQSSPGSNSPIAKAPQTPKPIPTNPTGTKSPENIKEGQTPTKPVVKQPSSVPEAKKILTTPAPKPEVKSLPTPKPVVKQELKPITVRTEPQPTPIKSEPETPAPAPKIATPGPKSILKKSAPLPSNPPIESNKNITSNSPNVSVDPIPTKALQSKNEENDDGTEVNGSKGLKNDDSGELKENEPMDSSTEDTDGSSKRKRSGAPGGKSRKKHKGNQLVTPKTPVMKLNEMKPGLVYNVDSQEGPPHQPMFTVSVTVDGQKYSGTGCSKQKAKHSAALAVLSSFVQFPNQTEICQMMPVEKMDDFTTDIINEESTGFSHLKRHAPMNFSSAEIGSTPKRSKIMKVLAEFHSKSPVMLLNELHPGVEYSVEQTSTIPTHRFTISVTIGSQTFEGTGPNKKLAKAAAAKNALVIMYQIPFTGSPALQQNPELLSSNFPQAVANKIATTIYDRFVEVIDGFDENKKFKVLSGLVMTTDEEMENVTVVAISTGTKIISGDRISMNGAALNDCHAEIISRRCFKDFIYGQLEKYHREEESECSILEKLESGGFRLKPNVKFHLYISTAPCGDARIFSPHELDYNDGVDKHPNRKGRGVLRTKIEAGEGTIPVKPNEAFQTWDGIQGGQRLLTMSCSDKITRWNVLGLQGSLLSLFVEPIYLESIILGNMYHEEHMYRAVGKRIELNMGPLPPNYALHIPKLCLVSNVELRQPTKSPNYCVNWTLGLDQPEIVTATTGKKPNGDASRLSKREFFQRFFDLQSKVTFLNKMTVCAKKNILYAEAKCLVQDYKEAKEAVLKAFKDASLGSWVTKPPEQDEFELQL